MVLHAVVPSAASSDEGPAMIGVTVVGREASLAMHGDLSSPAVARDLLRRLQIVQRRLPAATEVVHIDLSCLAHITIDVAVLLCVQRRLLAARGIAVGSVLRARSGQNPVAVDRILDALASGAEPTETHGAPTRAQDNPFSA
ncbi:hypothetical protein [Nocardioides sp.]|uniref:hypothetical protein n=1 Tax=Nocardioides sp. TaxID=35761 RepID=UPI002B27B739|nr:hypothetical protein [Nocardioides sp.]